MSFNPVQFGAIQFGNIQFGSMWMAHYQFPKANLEQKFQIGESLLAGLAENIPPTRTLKDRLFGTVTDRFYGKVDPEGDCVVFSVYDKDDDKARELVNDFFVSGMALDPTASKTSQAYGVDSNLYDEQAQWGIRGIQRSAEGSSVRTKQEFEQRKAEINEGYRARMANLELKEK